MKTGQRSWFVGAELYLPDAWLTAERRLQARIPLSRRFEEKWRLALRIVRRVRAAGVTVEAVVADAGYGNMAALRTALDRLRLPYVLGIASDITAFRGTPRVCPPARHPGAGRPGRRPRLAPGTRWFTVAELAAALPPSAWRRVAWRNGSNPALHAEFAALRVTPVVYWRQHAALHEVWLLCERRGPRAPVQRYHSSNLPATTPLAPLARLAHCRWAVEQQYRELKTDLGVDHFEGRTFPVAAPRGPDRARLRVSATGTTPSRPRPTLDRAAGPRDRARSVYGADSDYSAPVLCIVGARPSSIFALRN